MGDDISLIQVEGCRGSVCFAGRAEIDGQVLIASLIRKGILHRKTASEEIEEPLGGFLRKGRIPVAVCCFPGEDSCVVSLDLERQVKEKGASEVAMVSALAGDNELGQLFEDAAASARFSARLLCCRKGSFRILGHYSELWECLASKTS